MTKQHFTFKEIFDFAWAKTQQHAWFMVCTFMIYAVIMSAVRNADLLRVLVTMSLVLSLLSMSLIIARNESFNFSSLFERLRSPRLVINFFALTILYVAAISIFVIPFVAAVSVAIANTAMHLNADTVKLFWILFTTALLLIPGIYISVRFKFYPYVLLEHEHLTIVNVIRHTYMLTQGLFWHILWFLLMLAALNILGALAFGVGLIITVPISVFAMAHFYRRLQGHTV